MAYPQVADITATTVASASTTHNISMPATVAANDLLFVLLATAGDSITITTPSGWTRITTQTNTGIRLSVYGKVATGSEDGTTVNFVSSGSNCAAAQVYRITGYYNDLTTTGIDFSTASGSVNPNPSNLNPANWDVEQTLWIATEATSSTGVTSVSSYPSSYSGGTFTSTGSTGGTDAQMASARRENTVDAENPSAFSITNAVNWIALTIAIRPAFVSQTIEAPLLDNTPTFYDAAFSQSGILIPVLLDGTPTLYSPTFVYEQSLVLDEVLTITPIFYDIAMAQTITAPLLDNTPTFYGPEIINSQVLVAPLLNNAPTFYGPEFRGPRNIGAPLLTNSQTFYGPTVFSLWEGADSLNTGVWTDVDIAS